MDSEPIKIADIIKAERDNNGNIITDCNNSKVALPFNEVAEKELKLKKQTSENAGDSPIRIVSYFSVSNVAGSSSNDETIIIKGREDDAQSSIKIEPGADKFNAERIEKILCNDFIKKESSTSETNLSNTTSSIVIPNQIIKEEKRDNTDDRSYLTNTNPTPLSASVKKENCNDVEQSSSTSSNNSCSAGVIKEENKDRAIEHHNSDKALPNGCVKQENATVAPQPSVTLSTPGSPDAVTSSSDVVQIPPCRYGRSCYRMNEEHRKNFYHPLGTDPSTSPEKPRCRYGRNCYRKNEEHRKRFLHESSPDNELSNKRRRRNAASQTVNYNYQFNGDSDNSEDSTLVDDWYEDSSDEFQPGSDTDPDSDCDFDVEILNEDDL